MGGEPSNGLACLTARCARALLRLSPTEDTSTVSTECATSQVIRTGRHSGGARQRRAGVRATPAPRQRTLGRPAIHLARAPITRLSGVPYAGHGLSICGSADLHRDQHNRCLCRGMIASALRHDCVRHTLALPGECLDLPHHRPIPSRAGVSGKLGAAEHPLLNPHQACCRDSQPVTEARTESDDQGVFDGSRSVPSINATAA